MKCSDAQAALLTAEPAELDGVGASSLAEHVRGCERCRAIARVMLDEQAALAAALAEAAQPARTADQVANAVLAAVADPGVSAGSQNADAGAQVGARVVALEPLRRRVARRATGWRVWAPVALAAALAVVLLVTRPRHDWQVPAPTGEAAPTQVAVSAPRGKNVVVFGTRNPDIKVIWFYGIKD
jgi:hypothetical protein